MVQKMFTWPVILGAIAVAAILAVLGFAEHLEMSRLADHGKNAVARVEGVKWTTKRGMDRNFDLTITFPTEAGQTVSETVRVDTDTGKRARDDDDFVELPVVYLPEEPSIVRHAGETDASAGMFAIAAIAALVGLVLLVMRLRRRTA